MRAGAHDYLLKGSLTRLLPVLERELREAQQRADRRRAEDALREKATELATSSPGLLAFSVAARQWQLRLMLFPFVATPRARSRSWMNIPEGFRQTLSGMQ